MRARKREGCEKGSYRGGRREERGGRKEGKDGRVRGKGMGMGSPSGGKKESGSCREGGREGAYGIQDVQLPNVVMQGPGVSCSPAAKVLLRP